MSNLKIQTIRAFPLPGSEINEIKKEAGLLAFNLKCQVTFNQNGTEYIADHEGNVAIASKPYRELGIE